MEAEPSLVRRRVCDPVRAGIVAAGREMSISLEDALPPHLFTQFVTWSRGARSIVLMPSSRARDCKTDRAAIAVRRPKCLCR